MKKVNYIALGILLIFYISFGIIITILQENVVYHPNNQSFMECPAFKDSKKIEYKGTRMYVKDTTKPTVVLYHGNAGSACDRSFYADIFTQSNYGYIIVEYAGYSNDIKKPSHELIKKDVQNVISYIDENKITKVVVLGESIGTGVAAYHVSQKPPQKLILLSPFTTLADIASNTFWFYPTKFMVDNAFDNIKALNNFNGKILIIHGNKDEVIPYKLGVKLFNTLDLNNKFTTINGGGHNDLFTYPETYSAISDFLNIKQ